MFNKKLKEQNKSLINEIKDLERKIESQSKCNHIWKKINKIDGEFINTSFKDNRLTNFNYEFSPSNEISVYETTYWNCECIKCKEKGIIKVLKYLPTQNG